MMRPGESAEVYVCVEPVDFRKQITGLALIVQQALGLNVFGGQIFVFTNRRRDRVKCLYWERSGFVLWMKRLERERFHWPRDEAGVMRLNAQELNWLLDGFDLRYWRPHEALRYELVG